MISIDNLVSYLADKGYKITSRTIKYYIERDLLPVTSKTGGYREGVRLVFPDRDKVLSKILKIFELKGRGYKLSDIEHQFREDDRKRKKFEHEEFLKSFVHINGRIYKVFKQAPDGDKFKSFVNATDLLSREVCNDSGVFKFCSFIDAQGDVLEIERCGLFLSPYILRNGDFFYDTRRVFEVVAWITLHREYDISWDILESLSKKHFENLDKYYHWPNADGVRFSVSYISFLKALRLNAFGSRLEGFIESLHSRISTSDDRCDYRYGDVDLFITDFLSDRCAFVSSPFQDSEDFLKKF